MFLTSMVISVFLFLIGSLATMQDGSSGIDEKSWIFLCFLPFVAMASYGVLLYQRALLEIKSLTYEQQLKLQYWRKVQWFVLIVQVIMMILWGTTLVGFSLLIAIRLLGSMVSLSQEYLMAKVLIENENRVMARKFNGFWFTWLLFAVWPLGIWSTELRIRILNGLFSE